MKAKQNRKKLPLPEISHHWFSGKNLLLLSGILLLTFALYAKSLNNGFTNWDDRDNITGNADIRQLNSESLTKIFTSEYVAMYVPLTMLTYAVNYSLAGYDSFYFHLFNLLLHLVNLTLVYILVSRLAKNSGLALLITLFFAIHPLQVESVSWLSARSTLLYSVFYLGSLLFYLKYLDLHYRFRYLLFSLLFFVPALLAKSSALSLPLLLLLLDYNRSRSFCARLLLEKIPFFLLSALSAVTTYLLREYGEHLNTGVFTVFQKILLSSYSILFYPVKLLAPFALSPYHQMPQIVDGTLPGVYYAALLVLLALMAVIFLFRKKFQAFSDEKRTLLTGLLLYFLPNCMVLLKIVPLGDQIVGERYAYLPSLGILFLLFSFLIKLKPHKRLWLGAKVFTVLYALLLSVITWQYTLAYKDSLALWSRAIESDESCSLALFVRATLKEKAGDLAGALADYSQAIKHRSAYEKALINRGVLRKKLQDFKGAMEDYNQALTINPDSDTVYFNRANLKLLLNDRQGAAEDFRLALRINPAKKPAWLGLARLLSTEGSFTEADKHYSRALELSTAGTDAAGILVSRAEVRLKLKLTSAACADLESARSYGMPEAAALSEQYCR